jgi:predicted nucleotidyltransferase
MMLSEQTIREAVERLLEVVQPSKVVLFGSYVRGDASLDSDLDLMVIILARALEILAELREQLQDVIPLW